MIYHGDKKGVRSKPRVVAMGNFDGVHLGHQALFQAVRTLADQVQIQSSILTFSPHPMAFFNRPHQRLTRWSYQLRLIRQYGIEEIIICPFTDHMAKMSPHTFIQQILQDKWQVQGIVIGEGFRFGAKCQGTVEDLVHAFSQHQVIRALRCAEGDRISSTRCREAVRLADWDKLMAYTGRPFAFRAYLSPSQQVHVTLDQILPPQGCYQVAVQGYPTTLEVQANRQLFLAMYTGFSPGFVDIVYVA